jgi:hypothetical protein
VPEYCPDPFGEPLRDGVVESSRWDKADKSSPVRHECRQRLKKLRCSTTLGVGGNDRMENDRKKLGK